jgi:putative endonuclease
MAVHTELGKYGEQLAEKYLTEKGYKILYRNWRHSHYEIDVIAIRNDLLRIIEVKVRSTNNYGLPEENVTKKKLKFLLQATDAFLFKNPLYRNFQIDILSITLRQNAEPEYFLIEDVYL